MNGVFIYFLLANDDNPRYFTPQKICKASNNQIEFLPDTISIFWKTHLKEVDISENVLKELPSYIFELEVRNRRKCAEITRSKIRYHFLTKESNHVCVWILYCNVFSPLNGQIFLLIILFLLKNVIIHINRITVIKNNNIFSK